MLFYCVFVCGVLFRKKKKIYIYIYILFHVIKPLTSFPSINASDCYRIADFLICNEVYVICCNADPEGIANAQKSLGIGQEEKARRVR